MSTIADYHVRFDYYALLTVYFRQYQVLFVFFLLNYGHLLAAIYGSCIIQKKEVQLGMHRSPDHSMCICVHLYLLLHWIRMAKLLHAFTTVYARDRHLVYNFFAL